MASGNSPRWLEQSFAANDNNNLSKNQSTAIESQTKNIYSGRRLPVGQQYSRYNGNMKFRRLFSRDPDVAGLIRRARKTKKGLDFISFLISVAKTLVQFLQTIGS